MESMNCDASKNDPAPKGFRLKRWKFSLRAMLIVISIGSIAFGYWISKRNKHLDAMKVFRRPEIANYDGFEDPIGPNWVFTGSARIPANRSFPNWFVKLCCVSGYFDYHFESIKFQQDDLIRLPHLVNLELISFKSCELSNNWISSLVLVKSLKHLTLISTIFPTTNLTKEIGKLKQIQSLTIDVACLDLDIDEFGNLKRAFVKMKNLRQLTIICEIPNDFFELTEQMEGCDVAIVEYESLN